MKEKLAALAHEMWAGWMTWMFAKGTYNTDGTWTMPKDLVERWERQRMTPYSELSEDEKMSDRDEADKMLKIMKDPLYGSFSSGWAGE